MLNGQYVGCTTGFSQSDKTDIFIPNQKIDAETTPYLQRLVAVDLIKVEQPILPAVPEPLPLAESDNNDGFWNATSLIDAYEKAGEIVKQMGDNQRFSITLARPDGTNQITKHLTGSFLKHRMFGNDGGLYTNAQVFTDDNELTVGRGLSVGFNFVNENGVPTSYNGDGATGKPYPDGAGFVSLEIQGSNEFKIIPTGAENDLATIFAFEQPRFISFAQLEQARYRVQSSIPSEADYILLR